MAIRLNSSSIILTVTLLVMAFASSSAFTQDIGDYEPEKAWDGNPDLNGVWQAIGTAHWDLEDHEASAGLPEMGAACGGHGCGGWPCALPFSRPPRR